MKKCHPELFNEMKRTSSNIVTGWLLTRRDGVQFGYTSHDQPFTIQGVTYQPTNSFSGSASVSRNNLSVDNMNVIAICGDDVTDADLRAGVYSGAKVELFWCRPDKPEWGKLDIQGGTLGEITIKGQQYEAELRSATQKLQQPLGRVYTTECDEILGGKRCGVPMKATEWKPDTLYSARQDADASLAQIVKPTVPNGFWYEGYAATQTLDVENNTEHSEWIKAAMGIFAGNLLTSTIDRNPRTRRFTNGGGILGIWAKFTNKTLPLPITGGGGIVGDEGAPVKIGKSGSTEPAWPTTEGATIVDNEVTWRAIYPREVEGTVSGVYNRGGFQARGFEGAPDRYFQYGVLEWLTGENQGLVMEIRQFRNGDVGAFDLFEPMTFPIRIGDTFVAHPGCAKSRSACMAFGNLLNFQGFPDMPTEDKALTTPNYSSQGKEKKKKSK